MAENSLQGLLHGSKNNMALANYIFKELLVSSVIECALYCVRIPECSSINIGVKDSAHGLLVCQLNNATIDSESEDLISRNGFNYYSVMSRQLGDWGVLSLSIFGVSGFNYKIASKLETEEYGKLSHVGLKATHYK